MRRIAALILVFAAAMTPAAAQTGPGADVDFGPAIGGSVDFGSLGDQAGTARDFASVAGENGLVLMFVRSADWCPYCQAQLIDMNGMLGEIQSRGYGLASISYDDMAILERFAAREGIDFAMLSDQGSVIIDAYGLREERYEVGHRAHGVPKPIVLILDENRVVEGKLFEEDYRTRPPGAAVVEALDQIGSGGA